MKSQSVRNSGSLFTESGLYLLAALFVGIVLVLSLRLWESDLQVPIHYTVGGDSDFFLALFKNTLETGWYTNAPRLGAPGVMDLHDFPDLMTSTFVLASVLGQLTDNLGYVFNGFYGLTFLLATWTSLFVMRRVGVTGPVSVAMSLIFAFSPYHFYRGMNHPHYSAYFPVPLVLLICLWIIEGKTLFVGPATVWLPRWQWSWSRGLSAVLAIVLISIAGPYYAIFGVVLLLASGLIAVVRCPARWERGIEASSLVLLVAALYAVQMVPYWTYRIKNGVNPQAVQRDSSDYYSFALSLNNLLMPSAWHPIQAVRPLSLGYEPVPDLSSNAAFHDQNEAVGSNPLGLVGSCGLLALVLTGVAAPVIWTQSLPHLANLASLSLAALVFSLTGGFSEIIALHITPQLRSYNRMAVFLSFMALLAMAILINAGFKAWATSVRRRYALIGLVAVGTSLALWEQIPAAIVPAYARDRLIYQSDHDFVQKIEANVKSGSLIFQLPIVEFPESQSSEISQYDQMRGFYHSKQLRWSFGAIKGRRSSVWQKSVATRPVSDFLDAIRKAGFAGVYVNRLGYADQGLRFLGELESNLGSPQFVSRQGDLLFFPLGTPAATSPTGR